MLKRPTIRPIEAAMPEAKHWQASAPSRAASFSSSCLTVGLDTLA